MVLKHIGCHGKHRGPGKLSSKQEEPFSDSRSYSSLLGRGIPEVRLAIDRGRDCTEDPLE